MRPDRTWANVSTKLTVTVSSGRLWCRPRRLGAEQHEVRSFAVRCPMRVPRTLSFRLLGWPICPLSGSGNDRGHLFAIGPQVGREGRIILSPKLALNARGWAKLGTSAAFLSEAAGSGRPVTPQSNLLAHNGGRGTIRASSATFGADFQADPLSTSGRSPANPPIATTLTPRVFPKSG